MKKPKSKYAPSYLKRVKGKAAKPAKAKGGKSKVKAK